MGRSPRRYEVLTGTVLGQGDEGSWKKENRQLDVIVVDTFDYPTLLRNGDIAVVLPQAVRVIIEVKSDLSAPPDPDKTSPPKEPASMAEAEPLTAGNSVAKKSKETKHHKDTFLDAIKQASRNRLLFGETPILTVLLSHKSPAGNRTLRRWLELVVKTRRKLQTQLISLQTGSKKYSSMAEEMQLLNASSLPDVIIADKGAIAIRNGSTYEFFIASDDKEAPAPGLVTLVSYVVAHLYRYDPVVQLMRQDSRYESLRGIRQDALDLFGKVMKPKLESDDEKNSPLDLGELPPQSATETLVGDLLNDDWSEEMDPSRKRPDDSLPLANPEVLPEEDT